MFSAPYELFCKYTKLFDISLSMDPLAMADINSSRLQKVFKEAAIYAIIQLNKDLVTNQIHINDLLYQFCLPG